MGQSELQPGLSPRGNVMSHRLVTHFRAHLLRDAGGADQERARLPDRLITGRGELARSNGSHRHGPIERRRVRRADEFREHPVAKGRSPAGRARGRRWRWSLLDETNQGRPTRCKPAVQLGEHLRARSLAQTTCRSNSPTMSRGKRLAPAPKASRLNDCENAQD
jgi:hypothetical protein